MKELIERLRMATGEDRSIDHTLGAWMGFEGFPADCPRYTGSIDAKLPSEDIISMSEQKQQEGCPPKWVAVHRPVRPGGMSIAGRGNTEALARRIAALLAVESTDRTPPTGSAPKDSGGQR